VNVNPVDDILYVPASVGDDLQFTSVAAVIAELGAVQVNAKVLVESLVLTKFPDNAVIVVEPGGVTTIIKGVSTPDDMT
jgi:ethanolamine ammonia-lyase large subunit